MKSRMFKMSGDVGTGAAIIYSEGPFNESTLVLALAGYDDVVGDINVDSLKAAGKRQYRRRNTVAVENAIPSEPKPRGRKCRQPTNVAICIPIEQTLGTAIYKNRKGEDFKVAIYQVSSDDSKPWILCLFISRDGKWAYHRTNPAGFFGANDKISDIHLFETAETAETAEVVEETATVLH